MRIIALLACGATQRDAALKAGVSLSTVSKTVHWFYRSAANPQFFDQFGDQLIHEFRLESARWRIREFWLCLALTRGEQKRIDHLEERRRFSLVTRDTEKQVNLLSLKEGTEQAS